MTDSPKIIKKFYTPEEWEKLQEKSKAELFKRIQELANAQKWEEFCTIVEVHPEIMGPAFDLFYNNIPEQYKREFTLECYMYKGDRIAQVRRAIRKLPPAGLTELPKEYSKQKTITIYRAGEEHIEKAKYRLSWTLSKETALFFLNKYVFRHANYLYQADIFPKDVIAYTNERNEKEVIQYRKVFNVKELKIEKELSN